MRDPRTQSSKPATTWCLCIATYNRALTLRRCLEFALAQDRRPSEVVIIDGSDDWSESRDAVLRELAPQYPDIRWDYQRAEVRSLTHQRNQGLAAATSDVLFMIDDDSFLFPGSAAEVMRVYDADPEHCVAGVGFVLESHAPDEPAKSGESASPGLSARLKKELERALEVERLLIPYDPAYPDRPIPEAVLALGVERCRYLHGMRMTYRREVIQSERFDEMLQRYAAAEDLDASYRASRHGALVLAPRARLYHAQDPSARLSRFTRNALGLTNLAALYRLKGHDPNRMLDLLRSRVVRRMLVDVARDLGRSRFDIPCARADWYALSQLERFRKLDRDEFVRWYPTFQRELIERNPD
jgi:GT2 family glycosyltransferase